MGATAMFGGTALSAGAKIYGGMQQKASLDAAASELDQQAGQSVATGIQTAIQARRRGAYIASNAQAQTAAGGLTTTGTSAIANVGRIEGQAEYDALSAMYSGESRAQDFQFRAANMRDEGSAARTAGWISGASSALSGYSRASTILDGPPTFHSQYGGN